MGIKIEVHNYLNVMYVSFNNKKYTIHPWLRIHKLGEMNMRGILDLGTFSEQ